MAWKKRGLKIQSGVVGKHAIQPVAISDLPTMQFNSFPHLTQSIVICIELLAIDVVTQQLFRDSKINLNHL